MQESYPVIANRFANSIKSEISVMLKQLPDHVEKFNFGFRFHNLAAPCDTLVKYWGDKLIELGYQKQIERIEWIRNRANYFQNRVESIGGNPANIMDEDREDMCVFLIELENLIPILFFI